MQHFLIGSRLMKQLWPNNDKIQKRCKDTADYDVLIDHEPTNTDKEYFKGLYGNKTECHFIPKLWIYLEALRSLNFHASYSIENILFTLKASHVSFDKVHKKKTFYDLFLMSEEGCKIIEPLFYDLHKFWCEKFGEPWRADFTKESSDFFDDAVSRENVHDDLHKLVAENGIPAFKYLQDEGQTTVWVCPEKWKNVTEHIRQRVVIEEAQVLAIERILLNDPTFPQYIAYTKWVEAMVDRIAPLWMSVYILNNFHYFLKLKQKYYNVNN